MRIALAQINPVIGDLKHNYKKIASFIDTAKKKKAELVIFPELSITGYPIKNLIEYNGFISEGISYAQKIKGLSDRIDIVIGGIDFSGDGEIYKNRLYYFSKKALLYFQDKVLLPSYDAFDEKRHFTPGQMSDIRVCDFNGKTGKETLGFTVCEDLWNNEEIPGCKKYNANPLTALLFKKAKIIINIAASPFSKEKIQYRNMLFSGISKDHGITLIYVNQVGANDDLIFDGSSAVYRGGGIAICSTSFEEDLIIYDTRSLKKPAHSRTSKQLTYMNIKNALVLGIRDYMGKTGFKKAVVGLSGGIDSSLVCTLAVESLGRQNVLPITLPSPYSSKGSIDDSKKLCKNLGIRLHEIPISNIFSAVKLSLTPLFKGCQEDITEENIQARIRGLLLMAIANKFGALLLATGNKSEVAVGYCTLYGDTCGALSVISDLYKTEVYELVKILNKQKKVIPLSIMKKAPSAELRPGQKDQDSLPPPMRCLTGSSAFILRSTGQRRRLQKRPVIKKQY
ncbi:NAD+ synthase [Spirochaetota bacterium]